jgi:hypothetical protein
MLLQVEYLRGKEDTCSERDCAYRMQGSGKYRETVGQEGPGKVEYGDKGQHQCESSCRREFIPVR